MNTSLAGKKIGKDSINETFHGHDLRGTDFSGVNITGGRFCGALLGRAPTTTLWLLLLQSVLLGAASYFVIYGNAFAAWFIEVQLKAFGIYSASNLFFILVIYALCFSCSAFLSLRYARWVFPAFFSIVLIVAAFAAVQANNVAVARVSATEKPVVMTNNGAVARGSMGDKPGAGPKAVDDPAAVITAIVGSGLGAILAFVVVASIVAGSGADMRVRGVFVVAPLVGAGLAVRNFISAISDSIAQAGFAGSVEPREVVEIIAMAGAGGGFVFMLFGVYLGVRAMKKEEPELLFIRHFGIDLNALGATEFANATLQNCDFSEVDLKHVHFKNAKFKGCIFRDAKNVHLALTRGTPLELRKVRELVINRLLSGDDKNWAGLNLQGLDFSLSGRDALRNANFANANLNFANFSGCDLSAADLSEVNALGTRFNGCKLTGACIQHWNIDSRTDLAGVDCDFVYTRLTPKLRNHDGEFIRNFPANGNDRFDRNPPEGKFDPGDFTRIYKKLPATIDFIVKNKIELNALIRAIESINAGADSEKTTIQSVYLDREEGSYVVKLEDKKEFDGAKLYGEINEKKARVIQLEEELKARKIEREIQGKEIISTFHDIKNNDLCLNFILHDGRDAFLQNDSKKAKECIDKALEAQEKSNAFFGEIMKRDGRIEYSNFDVRLLAEDVIGEYLPLANKYKVRLSLSGNLDASTIINSDRHYLKRVLANLVTNGIKYADTSKGEAAMVTIAIANHAQAVVVDIIDNGRGIPPGERINIWKDAYRIANVGLDIEGSGLGLPFVRRTMDRLTGHQIQLEFSEPGAGTCFRLRLPPGVGIVDEPAIIQPDYPLEGRYVFLVEQDLAVRQSWIALMEANGAEYEAVGSMEELRVLLPTLVRYPDVVVIGYRSSDSSTVADVILALESAIHPNTPTLIIADEATGVSVELSGKAILRNPVASQQLLAEIIRLGSDPAWVMRYPVVLL